MVEVVQVTVCSEINIKEINIAWQAAYGVSARTLTPYPAHLNHYRSCTPASEDGPKESPKHVRQK
jgi:hypothetical protein